MSLRDEIAAALRPVVGALTGIGATWTARARTSAPTVEPRTYGTAADLVGHQSGLQVMEEQNGDGVWIRRFTCRFRTADNATRYSQGDQMCEPDGLTRWAVMGVASAGVGTVAYDLTRWVPLAMDANRVGGGE